MNFKLHKSERLCSQKHIDALYREGHRFMAFPWSVTWRLLPEEEPSAICHQPSAQVLIVAPKRKLRHAVDRNRAKRRTRELYRLAKPALYDFLQERGLRIHLSISYVHSEHLPHASLEKKFAKLMETLQESLTTHHSPLTTP